MTQGFRLHSLEVLNWGTFNQHIWPLNLKGGTALLTGENGSGKSTLIDALLTLLVDRRKRGYNQASGEQKRGERNELSYLLGAYGRLRDDDHYSRPQYLREKDQYSVLAAVFSDGQNWVTLAQVLWLEGGDSSKLKHLFIVADAPLTIKDHLHLNGRLPETLRKDLRKSGYEVNTDDFSTYRNAFMRRLNIASEKALHLFARTVSMKEIGDLNEFVREHMLEYHPMQDQVMQLRQTYDDLNQAHRAIVRAKDQLERLQPLIDEGARYDKLGQNLRETETRASFVPVYFAYWKQDLLQKALGQVENDLKQVTDHQEKIKERLADLRDQEQALKFQISQDKSGQLLTKLRNDERLAQQERDKRQKRAAQYDTLARSLELEPYGAEKHFYDNFTYLEVMREELAEKIQTLTQQRDALTTKRDNIRQEGERLQSEIDSLKTRTSQIPESDTKIRAEMARKLNIPEEELPFIGELLQVRKSEGRWEPAIQRLLGGYARQLLVPEAHYTDVSQYVNQTNLRGRLIYHRMTRRRTETIPQDEQSLFHKLEIRKDPRFEEWLKNDLIQRYDYKCCETLDEFRNASYAITLEGQIRRGDSQHEKDDRKRLGDRAEYYLGWDNKEKIKALERELKKLGEDFTQYQTKIKALESEQRELSQRQTDTQRLADVQSFSEIDWRSEQITMDDIRANINELERSSDQLKTLQRQLSEVNDMIKTQDAAHSKQEREIGRLQQQQGQYQKDLSTCHRETETTPWEEVQPHQTAIEREIEQREVNLDNIEAVKAKTIGFYTNSARSQTNNITRSRDEIIKTMAQYKNLYPNETQEVDDSIEALDDFRMIYQRIKRDDLPQHEGRFRSLLTEKVTQSIDIFSQTLKNQREEIEERIQELNKALKEIEFNSDTYIQLRYHNTKNKAIQEFRNDLSFRPDARQTEDSNEIAFQHIKTKLIDRFENDSDWTRQVTDVRGWLEFYATEYHRYNDNKKEDFDSSAGKSGGQKAKLAYTVLASAIAYQYGIYGDQTTPNSFRFVAIDEAFSKSDENNSRYIMKLFEKLKLQVLVVTPLDKFHVVEGYIRSCHLVVNNPEGTESRVLSIELDPQETIAQAMERIVTPERVR
ncbi:MAG: hypothetical protein MUF87_15220 [Anaerolineae bacterium]|nr:hypothetical protein [Anaerolineae bacterium]